MTSENKKTATHVCLAANTAWYLFNFRARLIEALLEEGYSVSVLCPRDDYVERLVELGASHLPLAMEGASTNPLREALSLLQIWWRLRRHRPDRLLTYTPKLNIYGALAARATGTPMVANISGVGRALGRENMLSRLVTGLYKVALRHPHTVFFQNKDDLAEFSGAGMVSVGKAKLLPGSGVDISRFSPNQLRPGARQGFTFLLAARLIWDKGIGEYVEAARLVRQKFPDARFLLAGFLDEKNPAGVHKTRIEEWEREGTLEFLGATDDMLDFYRRADCVVLPSFYREGIPRTLLEAASVGLPVITTDSVGCREAVVNGETGYLCLPRDAQDLADKMMMLLGQSGEGTRNMGRRGRARIEREFDENCVIDAYLTVVTRA